MYGILNQHDIIHYNTGIDIALIGIYENGEHITGYGQHIKGFTNNPCILEQYGFKLPDKIFEIEGKGNEWYIHFTSEKYRHYLPNEKEYQPTNTDAVLSVKHHLEELNKKYMEINGRLATEGVVINTTREDNSKKWLKCKPRDIEEKHKTVNGIPRRSITKECLKYFDEYGSEVQEIYNKDPNHHTEYLYRMLEEEYNIELIHKSKKKIERIFMQIWESKEIPISLHELTDDLIEKYPTLTIKELMSVFAREYPHKKKDARLIYGILEKKFIKIGRAEDI